MNEQNELGVFLRSAREKKGLSLRGVEKITGISNPYISQIESGKIKQPSPNILYKLCDLYEVSYQDVMQVAGYPTTEETSETPSNRLRTSKLGPITEDEEKALREYLAFLRSRSSQGD